MRGNVLDYLSKFFSALGVARGITPSSEEMSASKGLEELETLAVVSKTIERYQRGQIRFQSSWWLAACEQDVKLLPGTLVRVTRLKNTTWIVEPFSPVHETWS
jgi:membrane protein implicated in regulation of membrane protease activity